MYNRPYNSAVRVVLLFFKTHTHRGDTPSLCNVKKTGDRVTNLWFHKDVNISYVMYIYIYDTRRRRWGERLCVHLYYNIAIWSEKYPTVTKRPQQVHIIEFLSCNDCITYYFVLLCSTYDILYNMYIVHTNVERQTASLSTGIIVV